MYAERFQKKKFLGPKNSDSLYYFTPRNLKKWLREIHTKCEKTVVGPPPSSFTFCFEPEIFHFDLEIDDFDLEIVLWPIVDLGSDRFDSEIHHFHVEIEGKTSSSRPKRSTIWSMSESNGHFQGPRLAKIVNFKVKMEDFRLKRLKLDDFQGILD